MNDPTAKPKYLTAPVPSTEMPTGIPFIVGNEAAERFSFYGMKAILVTFMTEYLRNHTGALETMTGEQAKGFSHLFLSSAYFFPLIGAVIADVWLGKYRTILGFSLLYCFGHLALALDDTRLGLSLGLTLIAIGAGGVKPCVSAHVGDQFGKTNRHLLEKVFGWFYFAINFGAFFSTLLTPWLLNSLPKLLSVYAPETFPAGGALASRIGVHFAFGVPGLLMLLATAVFWLGRNRFVHIPPRGGAAVFTAIRGEGGAAVLRLLPVYLCVAMFWSLYDQTGSAWVLQAKQMNLNWLGIEWHKEQIQAVNPILVMLYIPLFTYVVYPLLQRVFALTPLRKIEIGFLITAAAFAVSAWIEEMIASGEKPLIAWQVFAYIVVTAAEIMVSITCLEFSYTQAPPEMKSFVMSLYLLSISLGNLFTALINFVIDRLPDKTMLAGPNYYWFFAGAMLVVSLIFVFVAAAYREKTYLQQEQPADT